MKINNNNDNGFNAVSPINMSNLASAHQLTSTYAMEALSQAMEILFKG